MYQGNSLFYLYYGKINMVVEHLYTVEFVADK